MCGLLDLGFASGCGTSTLSIHPPYHPPGTLRRNPHVLLQLHPPNEAEPIRKELCACVLTCFKKNDPCKYFQWVHWKVRPPQGPMDPFVQKPPRGRLYYTRPVSDFPSEDEIHDVLAKKASNQQLVRIGLDRFKKDNVKMYKPREPPSLKEEVQKYHPWGVQPGGFHPSPDYTGNEFKHGLYLGNNSFENEFFGPTGVLFAGVKPC